MIYSHLSKLSVGQTPRLCSLPSKSFPNNINAPFTGGGNLVKESGKPFNGILYSSRHKTDINYSSPFFSLSLCFLILLVCQAVREFIRGDVDWASWGVPVVGSSVNWTGRGAPVVGSSVISNTIHTL